MSEALEQDAEKACRDVGIATMLVGVMPGLGALTGLVVMPLVSPEVPVQWGPALGFLGLAVALFLLGRALRRRKPWSFRVAQAVFAGAAAAGVVMLFMNDESEKVAFMIAVVLPLLFVGGAQKAKSAVDALHRARQAQQQAA